MSILDFNNNKIVLEIIVCYNEFKIILLCNIIKRIIFNNNKININQLIYDKSINFS